jgi:transcriptional regulator with XRE-family HTH domain
MSVGSRLKEMRESQGLSASELSRRSGIDTVQILRIERETAQPRATTLEDLARALGVSPASFFMDRDVPGVVLSAEEVRLVSQLRTMTPKARRAALRVFDTVRSVFLVANDVAPAWA